MGYEEDRQISAFNDASFQIQRLSNLWLEIRHLRERGRLNLVRWKLDSAEVELNKDAIKLDKDSNENHFKLRLKKINKKISNSVSNKEYEKLYKRLLIKEKILRAIQEESGKGSKFKSADEDYM